MPGPRSRYRQSEQIETYRGLDGTKRHQMGPSGRTTAKTGVVIGIAIGAGLGIVLGAARGNVALGIPVLITYCLCLRNNKLKEADGSVVSKRS